MTFSTLTKIKLCKDILTKSTFVRRKFCSEQLMDIAVFEKEENRPELKAAVSYLVSKIDQSRFTVHRLNLIQLLRIPWNSTSKLAVVAVDSLNNEHTDKLNIFAASGGKVVSLEPDLEINNVIVINITNCKDNLAIDKSLTEFLTPENNINCDRILYTNGNLLGNWSNINLVPKFHNGVLKNSNLTLALLKNAGNVFAKTSSAKEMFISCPDTYPSFNYQLFCSRYSSVVDGTEFHCKEAPFVLHTEVIDSTMNVTKAFSDCNVHNVVCVADIQLQGKGRRSNKWISNKGCAMMSFSLTMSTNDTENKLVTECPSTIQLLGAMAVVRSLRNLTNERLKNQVSIKWPNDIYITKQTDNLQPVKAGGVLVNGEFCGSGQMKFLVGIGINLDNEVPTVAINQLLPESSKITREDLIASIHANFVNLVAEVSKTGFCQSVIDSYCSMWMHTDQKVEFVESDTSTLIDQSLAEKKCGVIKSVDSQGFLLVECNVDNELNTVTLHPDGNSFDLIQNLIYPVDRKPK